jgi:anti-sigma regulatory factor (Ser/Thr protein kinase)
MTPTEHCRVELKIPNDPRALGAVRGALQHTARHLGLPSSEEEELIAATDRLLRSAFASLSQSQEILVHMQEHPDRIEIEIVRPANGPNEWDNLRQLPGVDQVESKTAGGETHLKLVKRLPGTGNTPPHPN